VNSREPRDRTAADIRTAESVTEGHPDKVADWIADSLLDAYLAQDPDAHTAIEVLIKDRDVVVAGEVTSRANLEVERVVREALGAVGYDGDVKITRLLSTQAPEIARGVGSGPDQGAGDQGLNIGYASAETETLMPLPIQLAHAMTRHLADARKRGVVPWLRPDGKAQVSVRYEDDRPVEVARIVVSTQHGEDVELEQVRGWVRNQLLPSALGHWYQDRTTALVNPAGTFIQGGPSADCGVTGRKIIVDTYGGAARHGGGAFSGKDASKVDRSGAYFARWVARQIVRQGIARRAEVEIAWAIGQKDPVAVHVETFGTGDARAARRFLDELDIRPAAIVERFGLLRPIYRQTTNYGHFGKPDLPWEG
jgi:S-adenosylmethionine synthetase